MPITVFPFKHLTGDAEMCDSTAGHDNFHLQCKHAVIYIPTAVGAEGLSENIPFHRRSSIQHLTSAPISQDFTAPKPGPASTMSMLCPRPGQDLLGPV